MSSPQKAPPKIVLNASKLKLMTITDEQLIQKLKCKLPVVRRQPQLMISTAPVTSKGLNTAVRDQAGNPNSNDSNVHRGIITHIPILRKSTVKAQNASREEKLNVLNMQRIPSPNFTEESSKSPVSVTSKGPSKSPVAVSISTKDTNLQYNLLNKDNVTSVGEYSSFAKNRDKTSQKKVKTKEYGSKVRNVGSNNEIVVVGSKDKDFTVLHSNLELYKPNIGHRKLGYDSIKDFLKASCDTDEHIETFLDGVGKTNNEKMKDDLTKVLTDPVNQKINSMLNYNKSELRDTTHVFESTTHIETGKSVTEDHCYMKDDKETEQTSGYLCAVTGKLSRYSESDKPIIIKRETTSTSIVCNTGCAKRISSDYGPDFLRARCIEHKDMTELKDEHLVKYGDMFATTDDFMHYCNSHARRWLFYYTRRDSHLSTKPERHNIRCCYTKRISGYASKNIRKRAKIPMTGCPSKVLLYRLNEDSHLTVVYACHHHDHPFTEENFNKLQHFRRLPHDFKQEVLDLLALDASPVLIKKYIKATCGLEITKNTIASAGLNVRKKKQRLLSGERIKELLEKIKIIKEQFGKHAKKEQAKDAQEHILSTKSVAEKNSTKKRTEFAAEVDEQAVESETYGVEKAITAKSRSSLKLPKCKSTTIRTPQKLFIMIPSHPEKRRKWLTLARRHLSSLGPTTSGYFCEDHFELQYDMENYIQYTTMGVVSRIRMRPDCVPTKFACQQKISSTSNNGCRPAAAKRRRLSLINECVEKIKAEAFQQSENSIEVPSQDVGDQEAPKEQPKPHKRSRLQERLDKISSDDEVIQSVRRLQESVRTSTHMEPQLQYTTLPSHDDSSKRTEDVGLDEDIKDNVCTTDEQIIVEHYSDYDSMECETLVVKEDNDNYSTDYKYTDVCTTDDTNDVSEQVMTQNDMCEQEIIQYVITQCNGEATEGHIILAQDDIIYAQIENDEIGPLEIRTIQGEEIATGEIQTRESDEITPREIEIIERDTISPDVIQTIESDAIAPGVIETIESDEIAPGEIQAIESDEIAPDEIQTIENGEIVANERQTLIYNDSCIDVNTLLQHLENGESIEQMPSQQIIVRYMEQERSTKDVEVQTEPVKELPDFDYDTLSYNGRIYVDSQQSTVKEEYITKYNIHQYLTHENYRWRIEKLAKDCSMDIMDMIVNIYKNSAIKIVTTTDERKMTVRLRYLINVLPKVVTNDNLTALEQYKTEAATYSDMVQTLTIQLKNNLAYARGIAKEYIQAKANNAKLKGTIRNLITANNKYNLGAKDSGIKFKQIIVLEKQNTGIQIGGERESSVIKEEEIDTKYLDVDDTDVETVQEFDVKPKENKVGKQKHKAIARKEICKIEDTMKEKQKTHVTTRRKPLGPNQDVKNKLEDYATVYQAQIQTLMSDLKSERDRNKQLTEKNKEILKQLSRVQPKSINTGLKRLSFSRIQLIYTNNTSNYDITEPRNSKKKSNKNSDDKDKDESNKILAQQKIISELEFSLKLQDVKIKKLMSDLNLEKVRNKKCIKTNNNLLKALQDLTNDRLGLKPISLSSQETFHAQDHIIMNQNVTNKNNIQNDVNNILLTMIRGVTIDVISMRELLNRMSVVARNDYKNDMFLNLFTQSVESRAKVIWQKLVDILQDVGDNLPIEIDDKDTHSSETDQLWEIDNSLNCDITLMNDESVDGEATVDNIDEAEVRSHDNRASLHCTDQLATEDDKRNILLDNCLMKDYLEFTPNIDSIITRSRSRSNIKVKNINSMTKDDPTNASSFTEEFLENICKDPDSGIETVYLKETLHDLSVKQERDDAD